MTLQRSLADELAAPKYAHVERERRWLAEAGRMPLPAATWVQIDDLYLRGMRLRLRRMRDCATGAVSLKLTKKYASVDPTARPIVTFYLDEAEHEALAALPADPLAKRRYGFSHAGMEWSLDIFGGPLSGLALIEVEAPSADVLAACVPPPWAGREVTADPAFDGASLARRAA